MSEEQQIRDAYKKLFDWNWLQWGQDYEPANPDWYKVILDAIPKDTEELPEWLEPYTNFCPDCGHMKARTTENMASYPESFIKTYCLSCNKVLGMQDNSPYVIWWQYKSNGFNVEI